MSKMLIDVGGKLYMHANLADQVWSLGEKTSARYCRDGRVEGAVKQNRQWYMPLDATVPLPQGDIRRLLILTLWLRNNPKADISLPRGVRDDAIVRVYKQLAWEGYIAPIDGIGPRQLPYKAALTRKGFDLAIFDKNS